MHDGLSLAPDACVNASDLVRRFGEWQERALAQPVFVMRRGRPALVLTSFELMRRLCGGDASGGSIADPVLRDAMREVVIALDHGLRVRAINRAARLAFAVGGEQGIGQPLAATIPEAAAQFLSDLAARAVRAGTSEQAELSIGARRYAFTLVPHDRGVLLVADETTEDARAEATAAAHAALIGALAGLELVATTRINLRGYIEPPCDTLARFTGIAAPALQTSRFVTLLDIGSRVRAGEAIETAIAEARTVVFEASIGINRGDVAPVRIAIAPERARIAVDALVAAIVATPFAPTS